MKIIENIKRWKPIAKRVLICKFRGHKYFRFATSGIQIRLYFCDRCGYIDPRIVIASNNVKALESSGDIDNSQ